MAIDTTEKKLSLLNFGLPFWRTLPEGDGSIGQGDRQHLLGLYAGILAAAPPEVYPLAPTIRRPSEADGTPPRRTSESAAAGLRRAPGTAAEVVRRISE